MKFLKNVPLAPYTTLKIGGPAEYFCQATTTNDLIKALRSPLQPKTILGNGSNVLISDHGLPGLVIKNSVTNISFLSPNHLLVTAGTPLPLLINQSIKHGLTGLEEFTYIPGTLGGAIYCNIHGVNKNNFDKLLISIDIFNQKTQTTETLLAKNLSWDYDFSDFQKLSHLVILSATLQLSPGNQSQSQNLVKKIINKKSPIQPTNSTGSVFKNPPGDSAGRIIDEDLKLKGFRLGDAQISPQHANFIVNLAHATAADYYFLVQKIQSEAKTKLNLNLEPEIQFLGDFSSPTK
ncbi:MAG: UDP-N-acetylmuramate dehydrogenase [Patescibacteria group bacterium]